jgi:GTPase involved in cell partitioning and DNA repair
LTRKHRAQQNKQIDSYFAKEKIKMALKKYDDEYRERVSSILKNKADVLPEDSNITHAQASEINDDRNVKLIESFSLWLRMTFTGDCEDMVNAFCYFPIIT